MERGHRGEHRARPEPVRARSVQEPAEADRSPRNVPLTVERICPRCRGLASSAASRCEADGAFFVTSAALQRADGDPLLGATLGGRFGLLGPAAFGASSTVHHGHDLSTGEPCVVKVRRGGASFAHEARCLGRAPRELVPGLLGHGEDEVEGASAEAEPVSVVYLAMQVVDGVCAASLLANGALADPLAFARSVAAAVGGLHASGIVHGDLKPEHVFFDNRFAARARIIDFGSACVEGQGPTIPSGTPAYAAPELAGDPRATARSDVYALGVILYRAVAGALPFTAPTLEILREMHAQKASPKLDDRVPGALRRAIDAALAKAPRDRPESALDVARMLDQT